MVFQHSARPAGSAVKVCRPCKNVYKQRNRKVDQTGGWRCARAVQWSGDKPVTRERTPNNYSSANEYSNNQQCLLACSEASFCGYTASL